MVQSTESSGFSDKYPDKNEMQVALNHTIRGAYGSRLAHPCVSLGAGFIP
jgi:hypothetical protein